MTFFEKHVLFPKRFGIAPYFWLAFMIPTIWQVLMLSDWRKWLAFLLMGLFLKAYRDGYEVSRYLTLHILLQLVIAAVFGVFLQNGYLFIFTAWEIGSLPLHKNKFKSYLGSYYVAIAISLGVMFMTTKWQQPDLIVGGIITVIAAIGSPLAAKAMNESYKRTYHLHQQNNRLEAIIRQNERDRIAQDLHDNLGQAFSIITLKAELANKLLPIDLEKAATELKDITDTSRKNLSLVRQIVANLQERTLAQALLEEEKNLLVANIELHTTGEALGDLWPLAIQHTFSAVIKEAVTNMIRHSQADLGEITFTENDAYYYMTIHDNGAGFKALSSTSHGISGMERRLQEKQGTFTINSHRGTEILVSLPKEQTYDKHLPS